MRKITLGHLKISDDGKKYINDVLDSNRLSYGKYTRILEEKFSVLHECKNAVFCNSGTSALQIALAALREVHGYQDGDEVIVPALTFIATSNIVIQNGLKPVFVDVDSKTFNMDPSCIYDAITDRTRCIIPVHLFGLPADMTRIMLIARHHNLQVIEDSCETVLADFNGQSVGSFGDMACFSTYVAHHIVGGVGGFVTTNSPEYTNILRSLMAHGRDSIYTDIDQDDSDNQTLRKQMIERRYRFERLGYSYRATEMEAALALSSLEDWLKNVITRKENANFLTKCLKNLEYFLQLPIIPDGATHSWMMYPIVLKTGNRDRLLMHLEGNGIETRLMFPLLSQPIYRKLFPGLEDNFPVAKHLSERGFFIGIHQGLRLGDVQYISDILHEYFKTVAE